MSPLCGKDQDEHDENLRRSQDVAADQQITYNHDKSIFSTRRLPILGYIIENGQIRPDPDRLRPLLELQAPHDMKSLRRILGFFSHYSQWIQGYSEKIRPLTTTSTFPMSQDAQTVFESLKTDIANSVVSAINEDIPFEVETDASDYAIAATLNQNGRPVAFFSRMLHGPEISHASVEKEAKAIIEAVRHWRHYLTGRHFTITTDQRSVAYMFDNKQRGKIKNDKIMRWRTELSCYAFNIVYRPGAENVPPDTLSRDFCAALPSSGALHELHKSLCHPGVTCMFHFVKTRNSPYSIDDVRQMTRACQVCAEHKPQFYSPVQGHLIKATQPFERLNIDFKGIEPDKLCGADEVRSMDKFETETGVEMEPDKHCCADEVRSMDKFETETGEEIEPDKLCGADEVRSMDKFETETGEEIEPDKHCGADEVRSMDKFEAETGEEIEPDKHCGADEVRSMDKFKTETGEEIEPDKHCWADEVR